ncbi:MAG: hypothetical protein R2795_03200 [Saprospiraceae bacterium]
MHNGLLEDYSSDPGRYRVTLDAADVGRFRVPTLRNIAVTGPYMHDGSLPDLHSVIEHYNRGGVVHPNRDSRIKPLFLTLQEKEDLVAFLESLTDYEFVNNSAFKPQ